MSGISVTPEEHPVGQVYATDEHKLEVAYAAAAAGASAGGIPIGAALFDGDGRLLGSGFNLRIQNDDPAMHGETSAFHNAGRQRSYAGTTIATTLSPCWFCSGLVRQFGIGTVIVGEDHNFLGGQDWLAENGVEVRVLEDQRLIAMMANFIEHNPAVWNEDIGVD